MKTAKFFVSFVICAALIYGLDNRWVIKGSPIPPFGKFLDPLHGFWQNIDAKNFKSKELDVTGLKSAVTVTYDSLHIPHIFASNNEDLYLTQGYVTATDRLWQMEFQTHAAAGRISEILGAGPEGRILDYDRGQRRSGMVYGAQHAHDLMMENETSRMIVEKYTEGINQYIASLNYEDLPLEYKLLDYKPEPWTTLKCALLLKSMAQTLNMGDKDIEMTNALKMFGKETLELLYPDREPNTDPIVNNPGNWKFIPTKLDSILLAVPDEFINIKKLPPSDPTTGSNNWAVSGSKTATGAPILCGDPHLNLSLPSIWYAVQLHGPDVNVMGASLPGAPGVIIGFTDSIAWSVTNAQRDLVDWFKITYENNTRNKYLLDGEWKETTKRVEEFNVRNGEVFYDTVVYTHWGPITYDRSFRSEDQLSNYAFRWMSHDGSEELLTFFKLNRAKNHADYMEALNTFGTPAQNFVFASVSGDVAMRIQGKYPVRRKNEGKFVLDGSKSSSGWKAFIPNEQNVMYKNPLRGFVSSANQYPADSTYPYYITAVNWEAYRNRRINQVLRASDSITVEDMMRLQGDNYNLKAAESLPLFLNQLDTASFTVDEKAIYHALRSWDYFNAASSEAASYYEAWWDRLSSMIWDEMDKSDVTLNRPTTFNTIKLIKEKPDLSFFDITETTEKETAKEVLRLSFKAGVADILKWKEQHTKEGKASWGAFKDSYIGHLLRLEPFNIHVDHGGNHDIVNAHSRTHGPSWRMVVSLEKSGVKAWGVYPGGQSGNPGSYYYSNLLDTWVADKHFQLSFLHAADEGKSLYTVSLNPASK
jgi:penicillin G amidase